MTLRATRWDIYASILRLDSHVLQPYEAQSQSETPDEQHNPVPDKAAEEPPYDICYCLLVPSAGSHSRTLQYDSYGMDASGGPLRGDISFPQQHLVSSLPKSSKLVLFSCIILHPVSLFIYFTLYVP